MHIECKLSANRAKVQKCTFFKLGFRLGIMQLQCCLFDNLCRVHLREIYECIYGNNKIFFSAKFPKMENNFSI